MNERDLPRGKRTKKTTKRRRERQPTTKDVLEAVRDQAQGLLDIIATTKALDTQVRALRDGVYTALAVPVQLIVGTCIVGPTAGRSPVDAELAFTMVQPGIQVITTYRKPDGTEFKQNVTFHRPVLLVSHRNRIVFTLTEHDLEALQRRILGGLPPMKVDPDSLRQAVREIFMGLR